MCMVDWDDTVAEVLQMGWLSLVELELVLLAD